MNTFGRRKSPKLVDESTKPKSSHKKSEKIYSISEIRYAKVFSEIINKLDDSSITVSEFLANEKKASGARRFKEKVSIFEATYNR